MLHTPNGGAKEGERVDWKGFLGAYFLYGLGGVVKMLGFPILVALHYVKYVLKRGYWKGLACFAT